MENKNNYFCVNGKFVEKFGLIKGIILSRIEFWIDYNKEKKQNFHDDHYWSGYLSAKNISEQVFIPIKTIERNLSELIKYGVLIKGNYNRKGYDKTNWYRINPTLGERVTYPRREGNLPSERGYGDPLREGNLPSERGYGDPLREGMDILGERTPIPVNPVNHSVNKTINNSVNKTINNSVNPEIVPEEDINENIEDNIEEELTTYESISFFLTGLDRIKETNIKSYYFLLDSNYKSLTSIEERQLFIQNYLQSELEKNDNTVKKLIETVQL